MVSPKHKFYCEITFNKPKVGIGSVISFSSNKMGEIKLYIAGNAFSPCHVVIRENKKEYPEFDWEIIEEFDVKK